MKTCAKCKVEKSLDAFHRYTKNRDGRHSYCRVCRNGVRRVRNNPERHRRYHYGLTEEHITALLSAQGDKCVCGKPLSIETGFHVDHDHRCCPTTVSKKTCGECVRGLLCGPCNTALGHAQDNPDTLRALAAYLERTNS